jgi:tetratricopeptide (TPR) repeat protein
LRFAAALLGSCLLAAAGIAHAEPACVAHCNELAEKGQLTLRMNEKGCTVRLCQEEARKLYENREYAAAIESLDYVHPKLVDSPAYQFDRGITLYALGRHTEALESFDLVLAKYPESIRSGAQRAHTLVRLGRIPEARAQFKAVLTWQGVDGEFKGLRTRSYVTGNLGVLHLLDGDLDLGEEKLREASKIDGRNELAYSFRTRVLPELRAGTFDSAGVHRLVAVFEDVELGRPKEAIGELDSMLTEWPRFKLGYLLAARTQRKYVDYKNCDETLALAEGYYPDDVEVQVEHIRCQLLRYGAKSNDSRDAVARLKKLRDEHPDDALIAEMLEAIEE